VPCASLPFLSLLIMQECTRPSLLCSSSSSPNPICLSLICMSLWRSRIGKPHGGHPRGCASSSSCLLVPVPQEAGDGSSSGGRRLAAGRPRRPTVERARDAGREADRRREEGEQEAVWRRAAGGQPAVGGERWPRWENGQHRRRESGLAEDEPVAYNVYATAGALFVACTTCTPRLAT
jgi:hypothetical protein